MSLRFAHDDIRQIQAVELILMREQEEVRTNHVERRLHERCEVLGEAKQRSKELRDRFVLDRLGQAVLPRLHQTGHGLFGQAAAQLGAAFEGGLDKGMARLSSPSAIARITLRASSYCGVRRSGMMRSRAQL